MDLTQALLLGLVQGLTEFLPISSSGHLILIPYLAGWEQHSLNFDILLHLATALAVLLYFWRDWLAMARALATDLRHLPPSRGSTSDLSRPSQAEGVGELPPLYQGGVRGGRFSPSTRLALLIALGCIPAGIAGLVGEDYIEATFRSPAAVALMLVLGAVFMAVAERLGTRILGLDGLTWRTALFIGLLQTIALIPGTSRSGITIAAGLLVGLQRSSAARFSFLLATPLVLAAGLLPLRKMAAGDLDGALLLGFVVALLSGLLAIRFLLAFLQRHSLLPFVWYRLALAVVLATTFWR